MLKTLFAAVLTATAIAGAAAAAAAAPAQAERPCAVDAPCEAGGGEYALAFPPDWDGETPLRAILFYHGHNSSMASTMRSAGLRQSFTEQGWLLIAPQGERAGGDGPRRWPARPDARWRDDMAYTLTVLDDVAARAPLEGPPVVSGFSAGGSMAWMMGCYHGDRFAAVVSVAGALRRPNPAICPAPTTRALHVHGFADRQVPFEGRGVGSWHQGDVADTLALFRRSRGCRSNPDAITVGEAWRSRVWVQSCESGDLAYVEHDGGHGLPRGWTEIARTWLETGALFPGE